MLNMWKLDSTRSKHVIETNKNKQNSKNSKSEFLGTSMRAHTQSMCTHALSMHIHLCPENTILKHNQTTIKHNLACF